MDTKKQLEKIRSLSDGQKKIIVYSIVGVIAVVMAYFWINSAARTILDATKSLNPGEITNIIKTTTPSNETPVAQTQTDQTATWKTYANAKYGFEIKYPQDWSFREYDTKTGAAFFPKDKSSENTTGNGSLNIGFYGRGANYCKIPFDDYVKIAGPSEIQNYESLNLMEKGISINGVQMYKATWNYTDLHGNKRVSLPIVYLPSNEDTCGSIEAFLNDGNYADIYDQMLSTFKFIK